MGHLEMPPFVFGKDGYWSVNTHSYEFGGCGLDRRGSGILPDDQTKGRPIASSGSGCQYGEGSMFLRGFHQSHQEGDL